MDPVLLTRPLSDAERWRDKLHASGAGRVIVSPLLRVVQVGALPAWAGGLLLTSANAVRSYRALGGPAGHPAWCVGPRTASLAREAGLEVRGTAPDAVALARLVPVDAPRLLHLRGTVQRGDLAGDLRRRGIDVTEAVIYDAQPQALTGAAIAALRAGPVLAPLFSPRSAVLLAAACDGTMLAHLRPVCLSGAVAAALPIPAAAIAPTPDGEALFAVLQALLDAKDG